MYCIMCIGQSLHCCKSHLIDAKTVDKSFWCDLTGGILVIAADANQHSLKKLPISSQPSSWQVCCEIEAQLQCKTSRSLWLEINVWLAV